MFLSPMVGIIIYKKIEFGDPEDPQGNILKKCMAWQKKNPKTTSF